MPTRRRILLLLLLLLGVGWMILLFDGARLLRLYVVQTYRIQAGSMEPTILQGDHLFVAKSTYRKRAPRRGELAVFLFPEDPNREFVSRVVAVPGDRIEIRDKVLVLNGRPQDEPYAVHQDPFVIPRSPGEFRARDNFGPFVVPPGHYFMLGDNRDNSYDSRFYGPVDRSEFTGGPGMWVYWSYDEEKGHVRWDRISRWLR